MLYGYPPFYCDPKRYYGSETAKIYKLIEAGFQNRTRVGYGPWFNENVDVSDEAKDLIAQLLSSKSANRPTAKECLEHDWIRQHAPHGKKVSSIVIKAIRNFRTNCEFRLEICNLFRGKLA